MGMLTLLCDVGAGGAFGAIVVVLMVVGVLAFVVILTLNLSSSHKMKERARKIDPTVSTIAEAEYVLKKDIAKSVAENTVQEAVKSQNENNVNDNEAKMFCKHCGAEIDADSKFCNKCGKEQ